MKLHSLHSWDLPPKEAIALQKKLAGQVIIDRPLDLSKVKLVAGVDVSVKDGWSQAAVVIIHLPDFHIIETVLAKQQTAYPYIPGLLSFREGPVLVEAFEKLQNIPDLFLFDGFGYAHPRRIGIASHMGLWLDKPTIGCGKTRLCGKYDTPSPQKGESAELVDKGETIGAALTTRDHCNPMFISAGHLCDLDSAIAATMLCTGRYRLPEPTRLAHKAASLAR
ncbi:deoxyribonuclease V [Microvirga sp. W0021]|uniref:Endonuclease V n=1 Tax=Hohaiivirga grylli TaxID=3133970 RepID=A0ABV0BKD6_9HYPH